MFTFNKRESILNLPKYKLYDLAKHYKISNIKTNMVFG